MRISFKEKIQKVFSFLGISVGTVTTLVAMVEGFPEPLIASVIGFGIGIFSFKNAKKLQRKREDQGILKYLMRHRGASLTEIIVDLDLDVESANKIMQRLETHNLIRYQVSETGDVLYSIADGYELKKIISESIYWSKSSFF